MTLPLSICLPDLSGINTRQTAPHQDRSLPRRKLLRHYKDDEYICNIDWSSIESFTTCDRKSLWQLIHGRVARRSGALTFGSAIHKGLEIFYKRLAELKPFEALDKANVISAVEQIFTEQPSSDPLEWRTPELCLSQLTRYFDKYVKEDAHWTINRVEQAFELPLCTIEVNDFLAFDYTTVLNEKNDRITGKIDTNGNVLVFVSKLHFQWTGVIDLVISEDGKSWIIDHKTTSIEGDSLWKSFILSQQFNGYLWSARELGESPAGIIANVIYSRPPAKSESAQRNQAAKALMRQRYFFNEERVNEWKIDMCNILADFTHQLVTGAFPKKSQWCQGKYGECPYFDVCCLPEAQRMTMLQTSQYENNVWNPLKA